VNWNDLEEILRTPEKEIEREAEKTQIIDLIARIDKLQAILKKPDLGLSTLVGSEVTPRRQKLSSFVAILTKVKEAKEKERFNQNRQAKEKWRDQALKDNLHDLRYAFGTSVDHLMHQRFTMEVVEWKKPESTEFEIDAVSGHKIKIDLRKLVSPSLLEMLLGKAFSPVYLVVQQGGGYDRHGKRVGIWQPDDWKTSHETEIRYGTTFVLMRV